MPKTENLCEMVKFLEKYPKLPKRTEEKNFMNIPLTFNDCLNKDIPTNKIPVPGFCI